MPVLEVHRYVRQDACSNPDARFVFGDNVARVGFAGQAKEMRNQSNAIGVATLWYPGTPFRDTDFDKAAEIIEKDVYKIYLALREDRIVVFPSDGIGTGLSRLERSAPKIFKFLQGFLTNVKNEFIHHDNTFDL